MTERAGAPLATLLVAILTAGVSAFALTHPSVLAMMQRHPDAAHGLLSWRLLAPLLVHSEWVALALNLAWLVIVGVAVERRYGSLAWLVLYLIGGIVGELVAIRWQPVGAGNSIACFGLVGGLMALAIRRDAAGASGASFVLLFATEWTFVYAALAMFGVKGAVVAGVMCAPLTALVTRAHARVHASPSLAAWLASGTLALAALLCVRRDIHGPPLIAGTLTGLVLLRIDASARSSLAIP